MGKIKTANLFIIGVLVAAAYLIFRGRKAEAAPKPAPTATDMVLMRNRITNEQSWIFSKDVPLYQYPAGDWDLV